MRILITKLLALLLCAMLSSPAAFAQAEQTPERIPGAEDLAAEDAEVAKHAEVEETAPAPESSEVDFNEENFRRSMELRDANLQRSPDLTTGSYSPATGLKSLEALPEASQKHLREQLREVIVESGPWTPEEAGEIYPYVPSAEALENGTLENKEQAAWSELIAKYHEREAAIHGNAARSQAATGSTANESGTAGEGKSAGDASDSAQRAAALAEILQPGNAAGSDSASASAPPTEQGVSQNALELLTERQQLPAAAPAEAAAQSQAERINSATAAQGKDAQRQIELDSEGVIAIEDLEKVRLDPEAEERE